MQGEICIMSNLFMDLFKEIKWLNLLSLLDRAKIRGKSDVKNFSIQTKAAQPKKPFQEIIEQASKAYGIDEKVINAVIKQESAYNPKAVSSCGAMGLMQLMPATAKSLGVNDAFDTEQNIMAGTRYLKEKLDEFNGNVHLALAAYNAGSGAVNKYGGIPPYAETRNYVEQIIESIDYLA